MDSAPAHSDATGYRPGWLGANFWSRRGGPFMWRDYDGPTISEELAIMQEHGLNVTRSFLFWPDFHPTPDTIDEQLMDRLVDFLDRHAALGMQSIPTFIVGHMSGENWDPAWRNGRDLYADVWMVGRQAWFAHQVVQRFDRASGCRRLPVVQRDADLRSAAARAGPGRAGRAGDRLGADHGGRHPRRPARPFRSRPATAPGASRSPAWTTASRCGRSPRWSTSSVRTSTGWRPTWSGSTCRRRSPATWPAFAGRPVVLEEFGVSTAFVSDENAGHYYRQVLHTSLLAGATGWLAWNNTDYDDLAGQDPYRHHPFEMYFGITDRTGAPKAPLRELAAFREVLDAIDLPGCSLPPARGAAAGHLVRRGRIPVHPAGGPHRARRVAPPGLRERPRAPTSRSGSPGSSTVSTTGSRC